MDLKPIETLREQFKAKLAELDTSNLQAVADFRTRFLGKKGEIVALLKQMGSLLPEERPKFGQHVNELKSMAEAAIEAALAKARETRMNRELESGWIDVTEPGRALRAGSLHPLNEVREQVVDFFRGLGFEVAGGREIETDWYNFEALNIPPDHPARDMQDTFWLKNQLILRTHTSANQVRTLRRFGAPIRAIFPGRCFRYEAIDPSHENTFYQCEGLVVDKNVSVANLIATMRVILSQVFKRDVKVRLRPGYFPFVEPGFELDLNCLLCGGKGCPTCKNSGWIELIPCGLVHPEVLRHGGIDPKEYSGFAFGVGLTRLAMMKFGITDIRYLNCGDLRVNEQFSTLF